MSTTSGSQLRFSPQSPPPQPLDAAGSGKFRVAVAQISSGAQASDNQEMLVEKLRATDADLVVFPEAAFQAFGTGRLDTQAQPLDGDFVVALQAVVDETGRSVMFGMFSPADKREIAGKMRQRVSNDLVLLRPDTAPLAYSKVHVYDAFGFQESVTVRPGQEYVVAQVPRQEGAPVAVGFATCYDLRFPTQFQALARAGAEVIAVAASWQAGPLKTQQWQTLTAARAVDSTSYLLAADQAYSDNFQAPCGCGGSRILDPTGTELVAAGPGPEVLLAELDLALVAKVRAQLPILAGP